MNSKHPVSPESSAGLSVDEFRNELNSALCPLEYKVADRANSVAVSLKTVQLGTLKLLKHEAHHGFKGNRRNLRQIRKDKLDQFVISLPLIAPATVSQAGRSSNVGPGSCILLTTSRPYDSSYSSEVHSSMCARIPGPLLRQHLHNIDECCAIPLAIHHGAGKIVRSLIEHLFEERNDYSNSQADRFGATLFSALVNMVIEAPELTELQTQSRQPAYVRVFQCAKDFIESNLSNPDLDPTLVAEHCHVSIRNLYASFAKHSQSVWAYIRETRLQRCREVLLDPLLRRQSITQIAMRWGFSSSSSFNHIYRARFGRSPGEERQTATLAVED